MIKKNLTRGLQFVCAVGVTAAAVATTFTTTNVVASASAPTGTCALVASKSAVGLGGIVDNSTSAIIGTVTFNGAYAIDLQNSTGIGDSLTTSRSSASGTTVVNAIRTSGAYPVTFTGTESDGSVMNGSFLFLPTNNNLTYLVSSNKTGQSDGAFTGVCQVQ